MAKKISGFTIREAELATALEITYQELDKVIQFFDSDPNDQWKLNENDHFIYLNKSLNERLFLNKELMRLQNTWMKRQKKYLGTHQRVHHKTQREDSQCLY